MAQTRADKTSQTYSLILSLFCFLQPQIATSSKNELYDPITTPKTISLAVMMTDDTVM